MKLKMCAVPIVLGLAGIGSAPAFAARDDARTTPTKRVAAKTRLVEASLEQSTCGVEGKDRDVGQTTDIRGGNFRAHTPRLRPLAATIGAKELREPIVGPGTPVLIAVLGGKGHRTVPGAIRLKGARRGVDAVDSVDARLEAKRDELTRGDRARSIVISCLGAECWSSYDAAPRAVQLGYANVHWSRGGVRAWKKAKLPEVRVRTTR